MTAVIREINFFNGSTAQFRLWAGQVRQALLDVGLVKTADTGQIDLTTVLLNTGGNTSSGFDMFRFNDALQGQRPIFIKVEYGFSNVANSTGMFITVGSSTDGAGNITSGLVSGRRHHGTFNTTAPNSNINAYFSGDGSYLSFFIPGGNFGLLWSVERTRNIDGTANGDGVLTVTRSAITPTYNLSIISFLNGYLSDGGGDIAAVPGPGWGSTSVGGDVFFFPRLVLLPKKESDLALMFAYTVDVVNLTQYVLQNCGAPHTYMACTFATGPIAGVAGTFCPLVRFE